MSSGIVPEESGISDVPEVTGADGQPRRSSAGVAGASDAPKPDSTVRVAVWDPAAQGALADAESAPAVCCAVCPTTSCVAAAVNAVVPSRLVHFVHPEAPAWHTCVAVPPAPRSGSVAAGPWLLGLQWADPVAMPRTLLVAETHGGLCVCRPAATSSLKAGAWTCTRIRNATPALGPLVYCEVITKPSGWAGCQLKELAEARPLKKGDSSQTYKYTWEVMASLDARPKEQEGPMAAILAHMRAVEQRAGGGVAAGAGAPRGMAASAPRTRWMEDGDAWVLAVHAGGHARLLRPVAGWEGPWRETALWLGEQSPGCGGTIAVAAASVGPAGELMLAWWGSGDDADTRIRMAAFGPGSLPALPEGKTLGVRDESHGLMATALLTRDTAEYVRGACMGMALTPMRGNATPAFTVTSLHDGDRGTRFLATYLLSAASSFRPNGGRVLTTPAPATACAPIATSNSSCGRFLATSFPRSSEPAAVVWHLSRNSTVALFALPLPPGTSASLSSAACLMAHGACANGSLQLAVRIVVHGHNRPTPLQQPAPMLPDFLTAFSEDGPSSSAGIAIHNLVIGALWSAVAGTSGPDWAVVARRLLAVAASGDMSRREMRNAFTLCSQLFLRLDMLVMQPSTGSQGTKFRTNNDDVAWLSQQKAKILSVLPWKPVSADSSYLVRSAVALSMDLQFRTLATLLEASVSSICGLFPPYEAPGPLPTPIAHASDLPRPALVSLDVVNKLSPALRRFREMMELTFMAGRAWVAGHMALEAQERRTSEDLVAADALPGVRLIHDMGAMVTIRWLRKTMVHLSEQSMKVIEREVRRQILREVLAGDRPDATEDQLDALLAGEFQQAVEDRFQLRQKANGIKVLSVFTTQHSRLKETLDVWEKVFIDYTYGGMDRRGAGTGQATPANGAPTQPPAQAPAQAAAAPTRRSAIPTFFAIHGAPLPSDRMRVALATPNWPALRDFLAASQRLPEATPASARALAEEVWVKAKEVLGRPLELAGVEGAAVMMGAGAGTSQRGAQQTPICLGKLDLSILAESLPASESGPLAAREGPLCLATASGTGEAVGAVSAPLDAFTRRRVHPWASARAAKRRALGPTPAHAGGVPVELTRARQAQLVAAAGVGADGAPGAWAAGAVGAQGPGVRQAFALPAVGTAIQRDGGEFSSGPGRLLFCPWCGSVARVPEDGALLQSELGPFIPPQLHGLGTGGCSLCGGAWSCATG